MRGSDNLAGATIGASYSVLSLRVLFGSLNRRITIGCHDPWGGPRSGRARATSIFAITTIDLHNLPPSRLLLLSISSTARDSSVEEGYADHDGHPYFASTTPVAVARRSRSRSRQQRISSACKQGQFISSDPSVQRQPIQPRHSPQSASSAIALRGDSTSAFVFWVTDIRTGSLGLKPSI